MARAPRSTSSVGISLAGFLVLLLAVVVIGGTGYGYTRWQDEIAQATDGASEAPRSKPSRTPLPDAPTGAPEPEEPQPYEPPTFDLLRPTENRPQPVVLVIGDGYAAGRGASTPDLAYPALLGTDLGWTVETEAAIGAGYVSDEPTLLDMLEAAPANAAPDLLVVQGAYGSSVGDPKAAIAELATAIEDRYPDVPLVAVTPLATDDSASEARERTIARAWREVPGTLVLRPQPDGWGPTPLTDAGHRLIADELEAALRAAGLAKQA